MKRRPIKEYLVFGVVALVAAIAIIMTRQIGTEKIYPLEENDRLQILFLGDSNFAYDFGDRTIPDRIGERLNADIYNCAIGGTSAVKINIANFFDYDLDAFNLYNLSKIIESGDYQGVNAYRGRGGESGQSAVLKTEIVTNIDLAELDYIVIGYGLNDYTSGSVIYGEELYDETTYVGALRGAIERIQKACPNAKIILSSITYCIFYGNDIATQDGYEKNYGGGYINDYRDAMENVAAEYENVYFIDNLENLDINKENFMDYLHDEMHLNYAGQEMYVDSFIDELEMIESGIDEQ